VGDVVSTTHALPHVTAPIAGVRVVVAEGPDAGAALELDRELVIGTSEACDLRLSDPTVSRRHASLAPSELGARIRDLESRNGTWHGELRVGEGEIPAGASLRVGSTLLRIESAAPGAARAAPALPTRTSFGRFHGASRVLATMYAQLERAASSDATVLIEGESGTGKELLSEAIHEEGARGAGPFVVVDCASVPATLIESELFGHERGAFTGAERQRIGAFEQAQRGTIVLDEIGELPLALQPRLLRVLDRRTIRRVGGTQSIDVDVRVVAATNRNLDREVEDGRFRLDLFHRLAVILVRVPPLRDRAGDVELLARRFVQELGASAAVLDDEILARLARERWPGNVRELHNWVERLVLLGEPAPPRPGTGDPIRDAIAAGLPYSQARTRALEAFTDRYVEHMLAKHGGNVSAAARASGVARRHFQRLKSGP
jgi:DNA-binding NtrC family response regulator